MSDIGLGGPNARATNGGSRTAGPVPVVQPSTSSGALRTPRDVIRNREAREARKRAEAEEAKRQQEDERRRSAERRAAATAAGAVPAGRDSGEQRRSGGGYTSNGAQYAQASTAEAYSGKTPLRTPQEAYPTPSTGDSLDPIRNKKSARAGEALRPSGDSKPVANQSVSGMRSGQAPASGLRQSSAPASTAAANTSASQQRSNDPLELKKKGNASSFPHAFERWETLSSHWEGLTSYWLHKLEVNQEQIARNIPSASAMSRQITDLSAAGANLFHAVVELQRLRASSERKFQRWFFETRADQERAQETQAELERALQSERAARTEAKAERTRAEQATRTADNMVKEMRRELAISKEEARRAWEELGRREQEERDRTTSLREGQPTVLGGVQVVPMHASAAVSRQGTTSQRPTTREEVAYPPSEEQQSRQEPYQEQGYYEDEPSPTDTDPFTETSRRGPSLRNETEVQSLSPETHPPYPPGSTPATSGSVQTAIPTGPASRPPTRNPQVASATTTPGAHLNIHPQAAHPTSPPPTEPSRFYQQPPRSANIFPPTVEDPAAERSTTPAAASRAARDLRSEPSYVSSISDTEYEIGSDGQLRRDDQGRPLVYHRSRDRRPSASAPSDISEDYDVEADIARERELAARYRDRTAAMYRPQQPTAQPGTSAEVMAGYTVPAPPQQAAQHADEADDEGYSYVGGGSGGPGAPDYEGQGYGAGASGANAGPPNTWEQLHTAHHHPTRLSDVMEEREEEERSRASHGSRH